jgi:protoporphyrinogen oxidase
MIDGLEHDVKKSGGKIIYPVRIKHLDMKNKKIEYHNKNGVHHQDFDILINTIPIPELLKFTVGLPKGYVNSIKKLRYVPVVGLAFGTKDFLDKKTYWINIFNERIHIIYQHSVLIDKYKSKVSWCIRYGGSEEDLGLPDSEIKKEYLGALKKFFPDMKVDWCKVFRDKYAEPVYDKDYSRYGPTYETPVPYMFNAGIQVTFPKIRNMNVALESGEIVARKIIERYET